MDIKFKKIAGQVVSRHTSHCTNRRDAKANKTISSLGTERNYSQVLGQYFDWCDVNAVHPDYYANLQNLRLYLEERSEVVQQKTLDLDRQALSLVFHQKIHYVKSEKQTIIHKRSYTQHQTVLIASHQSEKNAITTELAFYCGLRAHESATILPIEEQPTSKHREWDTRLFLGMPEHKVYSVIGKGGLIRAIAVPNQLSEKLETYRQLPQKNTDRGIFYSTNYAIGFGQSWSQSFSDASVRAIGCSHGGHGLRHSFAKRRISELPKAIELITETANKATLRHEALKILSQELGHFRVDITFCYLR